MKYRNTGFVLVLAASLWVAPAVLAQAPSAPVNHTFVNQNGKPFALFDLKGKPLLVAFVYSRCPMPNKCPLTLSLMHQLIEMLKEKKMANRMHILLATLDPAHDTPAVLKDLARRHHLDLHYVTLATGDSRTLDDFELEMRVAKMQDGQFIGHSTRAILLGGDLQPITYFEENQWTPEGLLPFLPPPARTLAAHKYGANK